MQRAIVFGLVVAVVIFIGATAALCDYADWNTRPGTVTNALSNTVGNTVYLDAVIVSKIRPHSAPAYVVVQECFSPKDKIMVFPGSVTTDLRLNQTVDIQGTIIQLADGSKAIGSATILGYTDNIGTLLLHGPLIKGLLERTVWPWMVEMASSAAPQSTTESSSSATSSSSGISAQSVVRALSDPPIPGDPPNTNTTPPTRYYSISSLLTAAADENLVEMLCKPISSVGTDTTYGDYIIIGEDSTSDTLKIFANGISATTSDRVSRVSGQLRQDANNNWVVCATSGPSYDYQLYVGDVNIAPAGTIAYARTLADSASISLANKIVSLTFPAAGYFFMQEQGSAAGIRVSYSPVPNPGDTVSITGGQMSTLNGQRIITSPTSITRSSGTAPKPVGLNNRAFSGGNYFYDSNNSTYGQRGVVNGYGLCNIGLLVRTWGKVIAVDTASPMTWYKIDDGSNTSVKVDLALATGKIILSSVALNDFVTSTGVASTELVNGELLRVLKISAPCVTTNKASSQDDPTNNSTINFTANFDMPVTCFSDEDVTLSGTAGATTKVVTQTDTDGKVYNVAVTGMTQDGTVIASIAADKAANIYGVTNLASTSTDANVTYDVTRPTCTVTGPSSPTVTSPITFNVVFSESVNNLSASDITVTGGTKGTLSGSGSSYSIPVTPSGQGATVSCSVAASVAQDDAGNTNTASNSLSVQYIQAPQWTTPLGDSSGTAKLVWTFTTGGGITFHHADLLYRVGLNGNWITHNLFDLTSTGYSDYRVWSLPTSETCYFKVKAYPNAGETTAYESATTSISSWTAAITPTNDAPYLDDSHQGGTYAPQY